MDTFLLLHIPAGPRLRGRCWWADTRQNDSQSPGARVERVLDQGAPKLVQKYRSGALDSLPSTKDGTKVLSGGADNAGRMHDIATGQSQQVAQHEAPIKVVKWVETPQGSVLATGSWDKTLKVSIDSQLFDEQSE